MIGEHPAVLAKRLIWTFARWWARLTVLLAFRFRTFGANHVPMSGGVLVVSNHQSYLDPILLGAGQQRAIDFMARRSLFRNALFGGLLRLLNVLPVTRGAPDAAAFREAVSRLKADRCLLVFPEGTRTHDGKIAPLRAGAFAIAQRARVPVVPAVVEGAFHVWARGRGIRPGQIMVAYGTPLTAEDVVGLSREDIASRIGAEMRQLQAMLRRRLNRSC